MKACFTTAQVAWGHSELHTVFCMCKYQCIASLIHCPITYLSPVYLGPLSSSTVWQTTCSVCSNNSPLTHCSVQSPAQSTWGFTAAHWRSTSPGGVSLPYSHRALQEHTVDELLHHRVLATARLTPHRFMNLGLQYVTNSLCSLTTSSMAASNGENIKESKLILALSQLVKNNAFVQTEQSSYALRKLRKVVKIAQTLWTKAYGLIIILMNPITFFRVLSNMSLKSSLFWSIRFIFSHSGSYTQMPHAGSVIIVFLNSCYHRISRFETMTKSCHNLWIKIIVCIYIYLIIPN